MKNILIKLFGFLALMISTSVQAYDYDPLLMRAQATIFPKIILLDKDLQGKIDDGKIIIYVLHSKEDKEVALTVKELILKQYKNGLGKNELSIKVVDFVSFDGNSKATAYFLLKGNKEIHGKITEKAATQNRLVFSYDYKDFTNNALVSILMKEKTYIYLNKQAIHAYDINFLPLFYKIVKVIE